MAKLLPEPIQIYRDDHIGVYVMDEKGAGGAHHLYHVYRHDQTIGMHEPIQIVKHQEGPIHESGVNGTTNEVHLAIVGHRLECFQAGPFPSDYNKAALTHTTHAAASLKAHTEDRKQRNVEGQNKA